MTKPTRACQLNVASARSWLFVPGTRSDRFGKAADSGADVVICDWEDAVAPDDKDDARQRTCDWLAAGGSACARVNAAGTPWYEQDVRAVRDLAGNERGLVGVVVPKAEDPASLGALSDALGSSVPIVAIIESALGIQNAAVLARVPGVARLAFGSLDYCLDTGMQHEDASLLFARSSLVIAARAAGQSSPIDGVTQQVNDRDALGRDSAYARSLGFGGKLCIHPAQVGAVNRVFSPSDDEVAWARRILEATRDTAVTVVDGAMVDKPVIDRAHAIVNQHSLRSAGSEPNGG